MEPIKTSGKISGVQDKYFHFKPDNWEEFERFVDPKYRKNKSIILNKYEDVPLERGQRLNNMTIEVKKSNDKYFFNIKFFPPITEAKGEDFIKEFDPVEQEDKDSKYDGKEGEQEEEIFDDRLGLLKQYVETIKPLSPEGQQAIARPGLEFLIK